MKLGLTDFDADFCAELQRDLAELTAEIEKYFADTKAEFEALTALLVAEPLPDIEFRDIDLDVDW